MFASHDGPNIVQGPCMHYSVLKLLFHYYNSKCTNKNRLPRIVVILHMAKNKGLKSSHGPDVSLSNIVHLCWRIISIISNCHCIGDRLSIVVFWAWCQAIKRHMKLQASVQYRFQRLPRQMTSSPYSDLSFTPKGLWQMPDWSHPNGRFSKDVGFRFCQLLDQCIDTGWMGMFRVGI